MTIIRRFHFPVLLSGLWLLAVGSFVHDYFGERLSGGVYGLDLPLIIAGAALGPCIAFFALAARDVRQSTESGLAP